MIWGLINTQSWLTVLLVLTIVKENDTYNDCEDGAIEPILQPNLV